jgi:LssY C-terminus
LRLLIRFLRRLLVLGLGILSVWFIVFVVFRVADHRLPWILALALTYGVAAYVILPRVVRMSLKIMQRKSVPSFTVTGDGLPGDPVNLALVGTFAQLRVAFTTAGWTEADQLGLKSSWGMVVAFVLNRSYPAAPFSTLYLFGRGQDVGFEKAIDGSPRKRHHIRFWALSAERVDDALNTAAFWLNADRPPLEETSLWVGAGTKDTGFSLTKFTFQVTHATDSDSNSERDFIISELERSGVIGEVTWHQEGERLNLGRVNHYVADGEVAVARLA